MGGRGDGICEPSRRRKDERGGPRGYEEGRKDRWLDGCLCSSRGAFLRQYSSSGGIKCRWMSHRFIPIPVISYLRSAAEGATKGEEWSQGFVNAAS